MTQRLNEQVRPVLIGSFLDSSGERRFMPVSAAELERSRVAAQRWLSSFRFAQGSYFLASFSNCDAPKAVPFERAAISLGMITCTAEVVGSEAKRFESIYRRFRPAAAAAVSAQVLDGFSEIGADARAVFGDRPIWCGQDAYAAAAGAGLNVLRWLDLGPAIGFECAARQGAHLDRLEWKVESGGDGIVLSSLLPRGMAFDRYRTGLPGRVDHAICACGSADPRIVAV